MRENDWVCDNSLWWISEFLYNWILNWQLSMLKNMLSFGSKGITFLKGKDILLKWIFWYGMHKTKEIYIIFGQWSEKCPLLAFFQFILVFNWAYFKFLCQAWKGVFALNYQNRLSMAITCHKRATFYLGCMLTSGCYVERFHIIKADESAWFCPCSNNI